MNKRKSTLGSRRDTEAPRRLTTILGSLQEHQTDGESKNKSTLSRSSARKQPKKNRGPTVSNRGDAKERPVNRILYKRTALKPANSIAARKKSPTPCPASVKKLLARSKLLHTNENTNAPNALRTMRERRMRARATAILCATSCTNSARKYEMVHNRSPRSQSHMQHVHLTPQNQFFANYKTDCPSINQSNVRKRQFKSTAFELFSQDPMHSQTKQNLFSVDNNKRMDHATVNVTESSCSADQENCVQNYQKAENLEHISCSSAANDFRKESIANFLPSVVVSSPLRNLQPSHLQSSLSHKMDSLQIKSYTPRVNCLPELPLGHLKSPISSRSTLSAKVLLSAKSQTSERKTPSIDYTGHGSQNFLNALSSETNSASYKNNCEETNICNSISGMNDETTNEAKAALKECTEMGKDGECSLKKPQIIDILENLLNLQARREKEINLFVEKIKSMHKEQSEMVHQLISSFHTMETTDESKQDTCVEKESKASFSSDVNKEVEPAMETEVETLLVPGTSVGSKKQRRSSRLAATINSSISSTPDPCDKSTAVVAIYKDLRKSFTFLKTPKGRKSSQQARTPARTPRTVVSTSIRDQLLLLYDSDSPQ